MALEVQVVSPERILFSGEAEMVVARTPNGEIAFLTGHTPFIGTLEIAAVRVKTGGDAEEAFAVHGGFVEVSDNRVTVLSDVAEPAGDIDADRARESQRRAEEALRSDADDAEAQAALRRAEVRLQVAGRA